MRNLNDISPEEFGRLEAGTQLQSPTERHPRFDVIYPSHSSVARLNDELVVTFSTMQFPPMPQLFRFQGVDENGYPTIVTAGVEAKAPIQTDLMQVRASAQVMVQIAGLILRQVGEAFPEVLKAEMDTTFADLKGML